jgi:hypothetical protein
VKRPTLCKAIRSRRLVQFSYEGLIRVVEPYIVGQAPSGNLVLSGWAVRGSKSGHFPRWRYYSLGKIEAVTVLEEPFAGPRPGYNRRDPHLKRIFCAY